MCAQVYLADTRNTDTVYEALVLRACAQPLRSVPQLSILCHMQSQNEMRLQQRACVRVLVECGMVGATPMPPLPSWPKVARQWCYVIPMMVR